jgi:hypothetical protein
MKDVNVFECNGFGYEMELFRVDVFSIMLVGLRSGGMFVREMGIRSELGGLCGGVLGRGGIEGGRNGRMTRALKIGSCFAVIFGSLCKIINILNSMPLSMVLIAFHNLYFLNYHNCTWASMRRI